MNSTSKFSVGDKVRVVEAPTYLGLNRFIGKQLVVRKVEGDLEGGNVYFEGFDDCVLGDYLELDESATPKLTKKRRIEALEKDVARQETELEELRAKIEAMTQDRATRTAKSLVKVYAGGGFVEVDGHHMFVKTALTPSQRRAQIIADAKDFVEQTIENARDRDGDIVVPDPLEIGNPWFCREIKFEVNAEKRTVVALAIGFYDVKVCEKAVAKCAPDDVFNADIGKAIAVGRLFGLDIERFINAPKPDEFVVGHVISVKSSVPGDGVYLIGKVKQLRPLGRIVFDAEHTEVLTNGYCDLRYEVGVPNGSKILDDTEAQYE